MDFKEVVQKRYSCRQFTDQPVSRKTLIEIMEEARICPSACNSQRWLFVAIDDPEKIKLIGDAMVAPEWKVNTFASTVPAFICLVHRPLETPSDFQNVFLGEGRRQYEDIDIGIAAQQMMLSATNMGLGGVTIGHFDAPKIKDILHLPDPLEPKLFVALGYPLSDKVRTPGRVHQSEIFRFNDYLTTEA